MTTAGGDGIAGGQTILAIPAGLTYRAIRIRPVSGGRVGCTLIAGGTSPSRIADTLSCTTVACSVDARKGICARIAATKRFTVASGPTVKATTARSPSPVAKMIRSEAGTREITEASTMTTTRGGRCAGRPNYSEHCTILSRVTSVLGCEVGDPQLAGSLN